MKDSDEDSDGITYEGFNRFWNWITKKIGMLI